MVSHETGLDQETEKPDMSRLVIYVHGKGGSAEEFPCFFDLHSKGYDSVISYLGSICAM